MIKFRINLKTIMISTLLLILSFFLFQTVNATTYLIKPTGLYAVGYQDIRLVNGDLTNGSYTCPGKTDVFYIKGKNENDFGIDNQKDFFREIMLRVYYPINKQAQVSYTPYYWPAINQLQNDIRLSKAAGVTEKNLVALGKIKTFTIKKAPIVSDRLFPVVLFEHGSGSEVQQYENIIDNLVSHGYIVLAINSTFMVPALTFPDGRIVDAASASSYSKKQMQKIRLTELNDLLFIRHSLIQDNPLLSKFIEHMNLNSIGVFGHSAGAQSGVNPAVRKHPELFQAGLSLDGPPMHIDGSLPTASQMKAFQIPFLRLLSAGWRCFYYPKVMKLHFGLENSNYVVLLSPKQEYPTMCKDPSAPNHFYTGHLNFTDRSTLQYQQAFKSYLQDTQSVGKVGDIGTADGVHIAKLINKYVLQFFNMYLKNKPSNTYNHCQTLTHDSIIKCQKK